MERKIWEKKKGEKWIDIEKEKEEEREIKKGENVFMEIGRKKIENFEKREDVNLVIRMIEKKEVKIKRNWEIIMERKGD